MFSRAELEQWIEQLALHLWEPCDVYLIGGCALSFKGLKLATKDIDLVVTTKREFDAVDRALFEAGFAKPGGLEEFYLTAMSVYEKGDSRIDVFLTEVGKMLHFTPSMQQRATLFRQTGRLRVHLASNEDVFLFKAMTPRAADVDDCAMLIRVGVKESVILDECLAQSSQERWHVFLLEKLEKIEKKHRLGMPLKDRLRAMVKTPKKKEGSCRYAQPE